MNDAPLLTVYKASAGSGKTWRLTVEYLKLLLSNPEAYRSVLAVTFTNKATSEMKERVLDALYEMMHINPEAKPEGMLDTICREMHTTPALVKKQATTAMSFLLHDYGRFRVETIDRFFQSVLRNLARELGLGAYLNIELNNSEVLSDAVDRMIDRCNQNPELLQWMTDYIEEQVQEGKSWKINLALKDFGQTIFKEYFKEKEPVLEKKLSNKGFINHYKKELYTIKSFSEKQIDQTADAFFEVIQKSNLEVEDFSNGKSGVCGYFLKLKQGKYDRSGFEGKRVQAGLENAENWSTVKSPRRTEITTLAAEQLIPLLKQTEQIRAKYYPDIVSCKLAANHLNKVGLLTDIAREVRELNRENNRFLLSDTNALLKTLIDGQDASFVYEKTGTELHHILFDEFQDTSRMQWDSFRPLLTEGLANGYTSLIVGDEKQSIYRWRNGDWRILGNIGAEMHPSTVQEEVLTHNWRSERRIIDFNNRLFRQIEKRIEQKHLEEFDTESKELKMAYRDVEQLSVKKEPKGLVEISFPYASQKEEYHRLVLERLVQRVETLQAQGIEPSQIAILIRKNKYIPEIGEFFANYKKNKGKNVPYCYDIVSDDAFLLSSSKAVQLIVDAMRLLNHPENPIHRALLKLDYQNDVLRQENETDSVFRSAPATEELLPEAFVSSFSRLQRMPLYELAEELYRLFELQRIPAQDSYLYAFMDGINDYLLRRPSDLASFLAFWDEKLSTTSIPAGSGVNGIRVLSIHKSKGLEFHTVLIPFCDWKLLSEVSTQVWCAPDTPPYNQLDLLPIDYNQSMKDSCFNKEYQEETLQLWVDSLNLLYVAFTRARHNLIVFCQGKDPEKESKSLTTVSDLIRNVLENGALELDGGRFEEVSTHSSGPTETEVAFSYGALHLETLTANHRPGNEDIHPRGKDVALAFQSFPHKTRFKQSNRSMEFCRGRDPKGYSNSFIDRGKLLHRLFFEIGRREDVPTALQKLQMEGLIDAPEAASYRLFAEKALENPRVMPWFSSSNRFLNECSILCPNKEGHLQLKRPDRVVFFPDDNRVEVIDFKFGKPSSKYRNQVLEYVQLLHEMGYTKVQGFLWYVDEGRVDEVF